MEKNITDGFDPIRVPKAGEREIKALQDDEVMIMLDAVANGSHLTPKGTAVLAKDEEAGQGDSDSVSYLRSSAFRAAAAECIFFQFFPGRIQNLPEE